MPPVGVRFYIDESLMGIGKAYAILRRDAVHPGHFDFPDVQLGAKDDEWIPVVAAKGLIVILRDKRTRTRPAERAAIIEHGLRSILIAVKHDLNSWGYNRLLVRHWDKIEANIEELGAGPWRLAVFETTVSVDRLSE
jgi:hypothetical protein